MKNLKGLVLSMFLAGCTQMTLQDQAIEVINKYPKEGVHYYYGTYRESWVTAFKDKGALNYNLFHESHKDTAIRFSDKIPFGSLDKVSLCYTNNKPEVCKPLNLDANLSNSTFEYLVKLTNSVLTKDYNEEDASLVIGLRERHHKIREIGGL